MREMRAITSHRRLPVRLAEIALQLFDSGGLEEVCVALESGRLDYKSTGPVRSAVASGNPTVERCVRALQDLWWMEPGLAGMALALALRSSLASAVECRDQLPATQVVWTGPKVEGSYLRSTREVVRELLRDARQDILVIGYWIAARDEGEGIIEEVITSLGIAVRRGVEVTVIVDERQRDGGSDNRQALVDAWPSRVALPRILTWRLPPDDQYLKLHAKVLVADSTDALVTSANLTFYAMDRNMEMGVRVIGKPAKSISDHFQRLLDNGVIENFEREGSL